MTRAGRVLVVLGTISLAAGLAVTPSVASGESTTAVLTSPLGGNSASMFTWSYQFHDNGGHGLSNIAVSFCSTDVLAHVLSASPSGEKFTSGDVPGGHPGFGPGIKFQTTAVTGTLTVLFDQPFTAGGIMEIQSHSGDGDAGDLVATAAGPGDCATPVSSTTTVPATTTTVPATTTTVPATTTTVPATTTTVPATTTTVPATTTTVPATTTTVPATTTTVPATTTTLAATTTTLATTTTTVPATTSTSVPTSVLGNRFVDDGPAADLATTGFNGGPLVAFGALCVALEAVLMVGGRLDLGLARN